MLLAAGAMKICSLLPLETKRYQGWCLAMIRAAWGLAAFCAPWMSCSSDPSTADEWVAIEAKMAEVDARAAAGKEPYRPLMILGNHTSFFDTLLSVTAMPLSVLWRCRTYMDAGLFKMPILSTICLSIGHFPVYFMTSEEGKFTVDKEKNEIVDKRVNEHLHSGGWLCFFPEGQVNKEPDKLMAFRFGGMKKALEFDARLVAFVSVGNAKVWPKKAKIGGLPGRVRYSMKPLAPDGAKAFVQQLRKSDLSEEDKQMEDHVLLAKHLQIRMQTQYDSLKAELAAMNGRSKKD
eukprot:CAMPEP_0197689494 /NCGR_PEP_ID=MMETSP1338-20131121/106943_1 /TAXON_ID=43686 ORGANISM="Pelagodinium beii, Strain RCC1491" /NCGR_SAMPLE_ID=MMETSP1338 /ASSEMBLY_ACC=CAM_ASM_000754 /LENGTH=290 /DNA_ID=CAMNT_0043271835 /DNA_START=1 /DNA_END=873 /DNA_ORIENTATION=+